MVTDRSSHRKILFLHSGGAIGGAPVSMLQLAAALPLDRYFPLAVFTHPGPILGIARNLGVSARVVPLRSAFFHSAHVPVRLRMLVNFSLHFWSTVRAARLLVREERPDLVHLNTSVLIPAAIAIKRERVPLVWHVREVINTGSWVGRLQASAIARLADCVVVNSSVVAQGFNGRGRVVRVHNAVDLSRFDQRAMERRDAVRAELAIPPSVPVVGIVGSVQAVKGHYMLVAAARYVLEAVPEAVFLVVGGGAPPGYAGSWKGRLKRRLRLPLDEEERMRRMVQRSGLASQFRFAGYRHDIATAIAAIDVLAFPSLAAEGFGRPLIEAMAMSRPVVASDIGPSREILGEGTGALVPPADPQGLAAALIRFLNDATAREEAGRRGRLRVENGFTLDSHVRAVADIYQDVLASDTRASARR